MAFFPINQGMWAGPSYAGGQIVTNTNDPNGRLFARLWDEQTGVQPVSFLDRIAHNHDLAYEYGERAYGPKGVQNNPAMLNQTKFLADIDLLTNALKYRPAADDFIGERYRDMMIQGFYYVAVKNYGMSLLSGR